MNLDGIHHITAITGDAPRNVDFYTRVLGLRMTAKTVNQDDPSVYHLFYGDENAQPGADLTFFEYPGAVPGRAGAGMVHRVVWRVASPEALDFWAARLGDDGVATERGEAAIRCVFADPEGLHHELVVDASGDEPLIADHPEIPAALALQGFEGVRAYSFRPDDSALVLERLMGAVRRGGDGAPEDEGEGDGEGDSTFELRGERRGGWIAWDPPPQQRGRQSAGTIHHIAWATTDADMESWIDARHRRGDPELRLRRPPLLPLAVLPRARRGALRAGDARARVHRRRARRGARHEAHPAAVPRAAPRADRGAPDAAARPARGPDRRRGDAVLTAPLRDAARHAERLALAARSRRRRGAARRRGGRSPSRRWAPRAAGPAPRRSRARAGRAAASRGPRPWR